MDLWNLTLFQLHELIKKREISCKEAVKAVLKRIGSVEEKIKAFITIRGEDAINEAEELDRRISRGEEIGLLTGIPISIKDIFCTEGILTTCASKILSNFIPPYNATVVERLKAEGAIIIGKNNMDEFAMGSSTENSAFYPTRNPWDLKRVPGGSSGGSAAAVASGESIASIGTDTGGSIRQPAGLCGVVGIKPTYGRVSRYGMIAFASSLDQGGPITKDVRDCAIMLKAISGYDPRDSTSAKIPVPDYPNILIDGVKGKIIGFPREYFIKGMDEDVEVSVKNALRLFEKMGAVIEEVSIPHTEYAIPVYYIIATAEASSNLARYDGVKYGYRASHAKDLLEMYMRSRAEGFGTEVKRRIMLGTYALSAGYYEAYYRKAQQVRTLIRDDFSKAFNTCHCLITPTSPTPAFLLGEKIDDPLKMYLSDIFTISVNLAGLPAISIPCGFSREGLPIGMQIIGKPFDEPTVLQVAYAYEAHTPWNKMRPRL